MYTRPVFYSSEISIRIALTSLIGDSLLGNNLATLVRRFISLLTTSSMLIEICGFVVLDRLRCFSGNAKTAKPSSRFSSIQSVGFGAFSLHFSTYFFSLTSASSRSGAFHTSRISAVTSARHLTRVVCRRRRITSLQAP